MRKYIKKIFPNKTHSSRNISTENNHTHLFKENNNKGKRYSRNSRNIIKKSILYIGEKILVSIAIVVGLTIISIIVGFFVFSDRFTLSGDTFLINTEDSLSNVHIAYRSLTKFHNKSWITLSK